MFYKLVFLLVLAICVAVFAVSNPGPVDINLVFWNFKGISLALVILVSVLLGAVMIGIFSIFDQIKNIFAIRRLQQRIKEEEEKRFALESQLRKQKDNTAGEFLKDSYNY